MRSDKVVEEVAVVNCGVFQGGGFECFEDSYLASCGWEVGGYPAKGKCNSSSAYVFSTIALSLPRLLGSIRHAPDTGNKSLGGCRFIGRSNQVQLGLDLTYRIHRRDNGVDIMLVERFHEGIDTRVIDRDKSRPNGPLLLLINLTGGIRDAHTLNEGNAVVLTWRARTITLNFPSATMASAIARPKFPDPPAIAMTDITIDE